MAEGGDAEEGAARKKAKGPSQQSLLADKRFRSMFEDPAFAIDERAEDYKVLHPNAGALASLQSVPGEDVPLLGSLRSHQAVLACLPAYSCQVRLECQARV